MTSLCTTDNNWDKSAQKPGVLLKNMFSKFIYCLYQMIQKKKTMLLSNKGKKIFYIYLKGKKN